MVRVENKLAKINEPFNKQGDQQIIIKLTSWTESGWINYKTKFDAINI